MSVLVVEDDEALAHYAGTVLADSGFGVATASDGVEALKRLYEEHPDVVLLDINLPKLDGWAVLARIREFSETPVIMVTALGQEKSVVAALRNGADGYIVKPFRPQELIARIQALLRRTRSEEKVVQRGDLLINLAARVVIVDGQEVELTSTEFKLLSALIAHEGRVMSATQLADLVWGVGAGIEENVRVYVSYLRKKLGRAGRASIRTVRGAGYAFRFRG